MRIRRLSSCRFVPLMNVLALCCLLSACGDSADNSKDPETTPDPVEPSLNETLLLSAVHTSLSADGITGVHATLLNADGSAYTSVGDELIAFESSCVTQGLAQMAPQALIQHGIASVSYQPEGCETSDTITARYSRDGASITATLALTLTGESALSAKAQLGKTLFFDKALSASGTLSCAGCHAPEKSYFSPQITDTPIGGIDDTSVGFRSAPSAAYTSILPAFAFTPAGGPPLPAGVQGVPRGGVMWDGRASDIRAQAQGPFTGPHEMANRDNAEVQQRLLSRPYLAQFTALYGAIASTSDADVTVANMADAIAAFEREDKSFTALNSKFDAVQAGLASFTEQEANGMALFFDVNKAGCGRCHNTLLPGMPANAPQLFSDNAYHVLAVPRNHDLPYNDDTQVDPALGALGLLSLKNGAGLGQPDHAYYDLGFCGPFRTDATLDAPLCGAFRTPSLRNVAVKESYFHNGAFHTLREAIDFYLHRDREPARFYLRADGSPDQIYNDLPLQFHSNVDRAPPFAPGTNGAERLTEPEIDDLIAFLCTLTDGYDPASPDAYRLPAQCRQAMRTVP
ncbi:MAG: cytochrome-c peroxidase [Pseudomonadota bacterium]